MQPTPTQTPAIPRRVASDSGAQSHNQVNNYQRRQSMQSTAPSADVPQRHHQSEAAVSQAAKHSTPSSLPPPPSQRHRQHPSQSDALGKTLASVRYLTKSCKQTD